MPTYPQDKLTRCNRHSCEDGNNSPHQRFLHTEPMTHSVDPGPILACWSHETNRTVTTDFPLPSYPNSDGGTCKLLCRRRHHGLQSLDQEIYVPSRLESVSMCQSNVLTSYMPQVLIRILTARSGHSMNDECFKCHSTRQSSPHAVCTPDLLF